MQHLQTIECPHCQRSMKGTGFDYWLGEKEDDLFNKKARLEISGVFKGDQNQVTKRYNIKIKQTNQSDASQLPAYIGVVEFSKPIVKFGLKK